MCARPCLLLLALFLPRVLQEALPLLTTFVGLSHCAASDGGFLFQPNKLMPDVLSIAGKYLAHDPSKYCMRLQQTCWVLNLSRLNGKDYITIDGLMAHIRTRQGIFTSGLGVEDASSIARLAYKVTEALCFKGETSTAATRAALCLLAAFAYYYLWGSTCWHQRSAPPLRPCCLRLLSWSGPCNPGFACECRLFVDKSYCEHCYVAAHNFGKFDLQAAMAAIRHNAKPGPKKRSRALQKPSPMLVARGAAREVRAVRGRLFGAADS